VLRNGPLEWAWSDRNWYRISAWAREAEGGSDPIEYFVIRSLNKALGCRTESKSQVGLPAWLGRKLLPKRPSRPAATKPWVTRATSFRCHSQESVPSACGLASQGS